MYLTYLAKALSIAKLVYEVTPGREKDKVERATIFLQCQTGCSKEECKQCVETHICV